MATSPAVVTSQKPLEDPLAHLPCSSIVEYRKGQMVYNQDQPSTSIYLVIDGKVKVSRLADDGHQVVVDIYQPDEFFGESAFLNLPHRSEQATALENTKLMTWTTAEIEDIVMKRPRLAVALMQILVQRTIDFTHRIESFSVDNIARRLARRYAGGELRGRRRVIGVDRRGLQRDQAHGRLPLGDHRRVALAQAGKEHQVGVRRHLEKAGDPRRRHERGHGDLHDGHLVREGRRHLT